MIERRIIAAVAILIAAIGLAACGDLESSGDSENSAAELTQGSTTTPAEPKKDLPPRPSGVVETSGETDDELIARVDDNFSSFATRTGVGVRVQASTEPVDDSFKALCAGELDVTVASRRITDAELEACAVNGLDVVDFQVAFDAIVVATQNEADVGADCVNLSQLRAMFGAGSPVTTWNQLNPNFSVLRIRPAGPEPGTKDFEYFGSRVLGVPEPTLANYRSDYQAFPRDVQTKNYVAGREDSAKYADATRSLQKLSKQLAKAQRQQKKRAKELRIANKEFNAAGKELDAAVRAQDEARQADAQERFDRAEFFHNVAEKAYKKAAKQVKKTQARVDGTNRRLDRAGRLVPPGAVGIFPFSFYELWEEKLRPLEIDGQTGDRCVFPSDETISSELYPLESTLRLYTTDRSLRRPEVQAYIQRTLEQSEDIANQLELIPVPDLLREEQIAKIRDPEAGSETATEEETTTTEESATTTDGSTTTTDQSETTTTEESATTTETTTGGG